MFLIRILIFLAALTAAFSSLHSETVDTAVAPTVTTVPDSNYHQFVLDSIRAEGRSTARIIQAEKNESWMAVVPIIGVMIPIIFLIFLAIIIYRRIEATRIVRMTMIQNGMDPGMLNSAPDENSRKYGALRIGLLFAGIGLGLIVGLILTHFMVMQEEVEVFIVIASSMLFGGTGLILYHKMVSNMEENSKS